MDYKNQLAVFLISLALIDLTALLSGSAQKKPIRLLDKSARISVNEIDPSKNSHVYSGCA